MKTLFACLGLFCCAAAGSAFAEPLQEADRDLDTVRQGQAALMQTHNHRGPVSLENFVRVCGESLCLGGQPFIIRGATTYGAHGPKSAVASVVAAGLNTLELVEYEPDFHNLASVTSEDTWRLVDQYLAEASQAKIHVILHFASFGQSLDASKINPLTADSLWDAFLSSATNRRNTVKGRIYKNDPTIAIIELFGEINPAKTSDETGQIANFFKNNLKRLKELDPNHIVSSGGFSYLDWDSKIPWQTIMDDPNDAICDVEINAFTDLSVTIPKVTQHCKGKPWLLAAWSSCLKKAPDSPNDINYAKDDPAMAAHARDMYDLVLGKAVLGAQPAMPAVGSVVWNLGATASLPTCDIGPQTPDTLQVLKDYGKKR